MRISKILYATILLWVCFSAEAQNKQVMYDFADIPQSGMINPGVKSDFKWYAGVPGISGLSFQLGSSGVSAYDLFASDGVDFNTKVRERLINGMTTRDEFSGTQQLELLNIGFRSSDPSVFYSFGVYSELDAIAYWIRDYAILAVDGNVGRLNQRFDLGDLKTRGEMLNVFHIGVNKQVNNKITLGARGKIYSSIFDFNSTRNKGYFITRPGENNLLASRFNADMNWRTSGINAIKIANNDEALPATIVKRGLFGGNIGLGIDLGFTYQLNKQTTFTASLLDLGFIYHSNDVENYTLKGDVTIEGVSVILPGDALNPSDDIWQDLLDNIEEILPFDNNFNSYVTFRPTKLNASLRYNWGEQSLDRNGDDCDCAADGTGLNRAPKFVNGAGGQLYMINRPRGPQTALTAFYQRRIGNVLAFKTTYTVDKFSYSNIGFGMNMQLGPMNLYVIADNLLAYRNIADSRYASFQLGLNIISWGKK
jgi:hypothetical protein